MQTPDLYLVRVFLFAVGYDGCPQAHKENISLWMFPNVLCKIETLTIDLLHGQARMQLTTTEKISVSTFAN
jgi:hypothetical protein